MIIKKKLAELQQELKAPKNLKNSFGGYKYRSCEAILEALKPLLKAKGVFILLTDEMTCVGEKNYVKATATIYDIETDERIFTRAYAREADIKKGMDTSQITGSTSSYARKYALNGLLAIDDTKDADTMDNTEEAPKKVKTAQDLEL